MEVLRDLSACPRPPEGTAVTIGAYDGVHLGHRAVDRRGAPAGRRPRRAPARSSRSTGTRRSVVRPESAPRLLTDLDQKLELLAATGHRLRLVVTFDEASGPRSRPRSSSREVLVGASAPGSSSWARTSTSATSGGATSPCCARWAPSSASRSTASTWSASTAAGRRRRPGVVDRASATRWPKATWPAPTRCSAGPTRCGASWPTGDKRGRELGFPDRQRVVPGDILLPADGIYAGWYERPDGSVHPARHLARPPADVLRRPPTRRCSRRTSSTSTATSTASTPGCASSPGSGRRRSSTRSTRSSTRSAVTWRTRGRS